MHNSQFVSEDTRAAIPLDEGRLEVISGGRMYSSRAVLCSADTPDAEGPPNKPLQTDERRVLVMANLQVDSRAARLSGRTVGRT